MKFVNMEKVVKYLKAVKNKEANGGMLKELVVYIKTQTGLDIPLIEEYIDTAVSVYNYNIVMTWYDFITTVDLGDRKLPCRVKLSDLTMKKEYVHTYVSDGIHIDKNGNFITANKNPDLVHKRDINNIFFNEAGKFIVEQSYSYWRAGNTLSAIYCALLEDDDVNLSNTIGAEERSNGNILIGLSNRIDLYKEQLYSVLEELEKVKAANNEIEYDPKEWLKGYFEVYLFLGTKWHEYAVYPEFHSAVKTDK